MMHGTKTRPELVAELEEVRGRLAEVEQALGALRNGEVDALVLPTPEGPRVFSVRLDGGNGLVLSSPTGQQVFSLRGSDEPYRLLIERMNEGAATLSPDGLILYCNRRLADLLGRPLEQVQGERLCAFVPPPDRAALDRLLGSRGDQGAPTEMQLLSGDGAQIPVLLSAGGMRIDEKDYVGVAVTDLTAVRQTEQALRTSQAQMQAIMDHSPAAIFVKDLEGRHLFVNRRLEKLHYLGRDQIIGKTDYDLFPREIADAFRANDRAMLASGAPLESEEVVPQVDGPHPHLSLKFPLRDENGRPYAICGISTDITERKKEEEENIKLVALATNSSDFIGLAALDGHLTFLNHAGRALVGLLDQHDVSTLTIWDFAQPDTHGEIRDRILPTFWESGYWQGEILFRHFQTGEVIPVEMLSFVVRNLQTGEPLCLATVSRDIRERRRMEEALNRSHHELELRVQERTAELVRANTALRASEEQVRLLLDSTGDAIYGVDLQGNCIICNPACAHLLGHDGPTALLGRNMHALMHHSRPDGAPYPQAECPIEQVLRLGQATRAEDEVFWRADGTSFPVEYRAHPLHRDGQVVGAVVTFTDLTERRRARAALEESEAAFRAMAENVPEMIWMCTPDGLNVYFNQQWVGYTGLSLAECSGAAWSTPFHPDDKQKARVAWKTTVESGGAVPYQIECRLRKADGSYRWFLIKGVPLRDDAGQVLKWFGTCTDIHDLKEAAEALRRANAHNRRLIEASLDPMVTIGRDGRITDVNAATEGATGRTREELVGADFSDYFTEPEKAGAGYQQVFREGIVRDYPLEIQHSDGRSTPVLYNATVYRDESGTVLGVFAAARDVTERNRAEEALRQSEDRYRSLVVATAQIIWTTNDRGEVCQDMPSWRAYTGQTWEESRGTGWYAALHPDDRARTLEVWSRAVAARTPYDTEYRIQRHDGEYRHVSVRGVPVLGGDGTVREWVGTCTDITEQKRAEAEIRVLNAELEQRVQQRTADLVSAGARMKRDATLIEAINEALSQFITAEPPPVVFARVLDRLVNLTGSEYGFIGEIVYPTDGRPYLQDWAITASAWTEAMRAYYPHFISGSLHFTRLDSLYGAVMTTGQPVIANDPAHDQRRCSTPPGHPPLNAFLGLPLHWGTELVGMIGLANAPGGYGEEMVDHLRPMVKACSSIIAAWRSEQQRQKAEKQLRQLTGQLKMRSAELETSNNELEAFAYSVSHDLRAPLRAIDGFSQLLVKDLGDKVPEKQRHYLQVVRDNAQQMGRLIDDLLRFSRTSRQSLLKQVVPTTDLVRQCLDELASEREGRRVEILVGELPDCLGDATLLKQVWLNLLSNALKFTRQRDPAHIEIGSLDREAQTVFFVGDNGVGFDMQYADKLFGVFQRLHRPEDYEGTGIGLALVQRIVHRHGGRIWADARPNEGATFFFTLGRRNAQV
jgi:PAS domain S-box-containing protein